VQEAPALTSQEVVLALKPRGRQFSVIHKLEKAPDQKQETQTSKPVHEPDVVIDAKALPMYILQVRTCFEDCSHCNDTAPVPV